MGHDANEGGHQDAGDGGQHVCQSHQGARKVGGQVRLVGEHPREHAVGKTVGLDMLQLQYFCMLLSWILQYDKYNEDDKKTGFTFHTT